MFWTAYATSTAICREVAHASIGTLDVRGLRIRFPPLGRPVVLLSNLIVILVLCFYRLDTLDQWKWEDIGYRTGFITLSQLPLIFLLASKRNFIGFLTGVSYERLNWVHRWTARTLWLTATIHMAFWFKSWNRYDRIGINITTDQITQRGFAAWCILTFIVASSFAPVRKWNYELFLVVHLVTFSGFIGAVWLHVPKEVKAYVWIPIGLFFLDRLLRALNTIFLNLNVFQRLQRRNSRSGSSATDQIRSSSFWATRAELTPLPGNVTRVTIHTQTARWSPGQHMFMSCHSVAPLQSHPFTIASLMSDEKLEFLVHAKQGGTKRFFDHASKYQQLPSSERNSSLSSKLATIEGPYGQMRPLRQFDSVVFFAGSTGATFTVPLMRDIAQTWLKDCEFSRSSLVTRRIRFVWAIKSRDQLSWFSDQLQQVLRDTNRCRASSQGYDYAVDISIYVTCDENFLAEKRGQVSCCKSPLYAAMTDHVPNPSRPSGHDSEHRSPSADDVVDGASSTLASRIGSSSESGQTPEYTCCCKSTMTEEANGSPCTCSDDPFLFQGSTSTFKDDMGSFRIVSGRPHPRSIIRKVLEEAEGESAIVVCGPIGLKDDVRNSVVALSDERAVHKGTGAQGIYLHIEGFDY